MLLLLLSPFCVFVNQKLKLKNRSFNRSLADLDYSIFHLTHALCAEFQHVNIYQRICSFVALLQLPARVQCMLAHMNINGPMFVCGAPFCHKQWHNTKYTLHQMTMIQCSVNAFHQINFNQLRSFFSFFLFICTRTAHNVFQFNENVPFVSVSNGKK